MTTAKLILYTHNRTANGHPIKIRVHNVGNKYVNLKEYSEKKDWGDGNVKRSHPDYRRLHNKLMRRQTLLNEQLEFCERHRLDLKDSHKLISEGLDRELEIMLLRKRLRELENDGGIGLIEFIELRIKEKSKRGESVDAYSAFKGVLSSYLPMDIPINSITYEWLNRFSLDNSHHRKSTVKDYIDRLKALYREAQKRESLGIKKDNPFGDIRISGKDAKKKYEITKEGFLNLVNNIERPYIAVFVFQFAIGGHDLIDVANLRWSDITKGRVNFKRYKNRGKANGGPSVSNKLFPLALRIIDMHGNKDSKRMFDFIPCPKIKDADYKRYRSREFAKLVRFHNNGRIGFKTPRHAFRTFSGNLLIDRFVVESLQGHTPEGMTFNYQRGLPFEVLDKEHKKVLDHLLKP